MIRYTAFCKIIECGSFTKAAEALGYTQAAVSQMIRSLENGLSLTLLVRTRTGIHLTPEGQQLYPLIQKYASVYRELKDKAGEINGLEAGEIRIGTFSSMSQNVLPGLMSDFSKLYPQINFTLCQGDNTTLPELIKNGTIDMGFLYPEAAAGLCNRLFAQDDYLVVFPEGHKYGKMKSVPLSLIAEEPLIVVEEGSINTVLNAFSAAGLSPRIKFRIHDDYTILSMVEKGMGVSILPAMILDRATYKVETAPINSPVRRTVGISYQNFDLLPIAAKRFVKYMFEHISDYLPEKYIYSGLSKEKI